MSTLLFTALTLSLALGAGACATHEEPHFTPSRPEAPARDPVEVSAASDPSAEHAAGSASHTPGVQLTFQPFDGATSADATEPMVGLLGIHEDDYAAVQSAVTLRRYAAGAGEREIPITVRHELPDGTHGAPIQWMVAESATLSPGWYEVGLDLQRISGPLAARLSARPQPLSARFHIGALPSVLSVDDAWRDDGALLVRVRFSERVRFAEPLVSQIRVHQRGRALQCSDPDGLRVHDEEGVQIIGLTCAGAGSGDLVIELRPGIRNLLDMPLVDAAGAPLQRLDLPLAAQGAEVRTTPLADALDALRALDAP